MLDEQGFWGARAWADVLVDLEANEAGAELFREMIRRTVDDPEVAEKLSPRGYPIGCKRLVFGVDYYEAFNRDNVTVVDLRDGGIESITPTGIRTGQGALRARRDHLRDRIRRDDRRAEPDRHPRARRRAAPRRVGRAAPARCSGVQSVGFPNLFTITGPGSPSVLANMVVGIEQHVGVDRRLPHLPPRPRVPARSSRRSTRRTTWVEHVNEVAEGTMYTAATLQLVVPRREHPRQAAGVPALCRRTSRRTSSSADAVAAAGYEGFALGVAQRWSRSL